MKTLRFTLTALLVAGAMAVMSCGDLAPVAPRSMDVALQADRGGLLSQTLKKTGLLSCTALPYASATKTIGPEGGVINVGPHTLTVPAGALRRNVQITATAPSGTTSHIDFQPAGLEFRVPASVTMSYANCNLFGTLTPKQIAYTNDDLTEIYYYLLGSNDLLAKKVTGQLHHFSDYVVAW